MSDGKKTGENSSSEVVNQFRSCRDLSDIVPLYTSRSLYLKPHAKVNVSVNLPQLKTPGKIPNSWSYSVLPSITSRNRNLPLRTKIYFYETVKREIVYLIKFT